MVATVPKGWQNCAKLLEVHLSGGGGTPWLQPKSILTFKLSPLDVLKVFATDFGFKTCHYSGHCAHRVANLCKTAANARFRM